MNVTRIMAVVRGPGGFWALIMGREEPFVARLAVRGSGEGRNSVRPGVSDMEANLGKCWRRE